ncbi:hypothetical protein TruAng_002504 [Truncatella angustata]|nr:hypothetical protein TruAng_002504 [Truncatella angustata]
MRFSIALVSGTVLGAASADIFSFSASSDDLKLASKDTAPVIALCKDESWAVQRTAQDLAWDFGRVVGLNGTVTIVDGNRDNLATWSSSRGRGDTPIIVAGTVGHSRLIDGLISERKLDVSSIKGKWESYTTQVIRNPINGVSWALVITGSDRRGTIYGLYDMSEQIGVSLWYWWADVPVQKKQAIWIGSSGKVQGPPSIKYRGFFINDEAPALAGWIAEKFPGGFGSDFYRLVFELCLRLKGNYVWPAMWGKMFYVDDALNGKLADDFGVIMGTSHHEPMARSEREQQIYLNGTWDWISNRDNIIKFFKDGIARARTWDTMWTMGMRGSGDVASPTLTAPALEDIIQVQQSLLEQGLNTTNLTSIPQTWVLYKEVGEYYKAGLKVPDSVTLLWTDDNSGNLLRVPLANETSRTAGAGVYYHFDYVGGPRSYKWINTIQLVKTWEQMSFAYTRGARQIWIANIGDIKTLEIPLTHFMDMAYDVTRYTTPDSTRIWIERWARREFGEHAAKPTVDILSQYGILLGRRKYELLSELPFAISTSNYDEAERNLDQWGKLLKQTQAVYDSLDKATQTAYFQMVLHPVLAGKTVVDLYTKVALNARFAKQGRASTNQIALEAGNLFAEDAKITDRYHTLNDGKWNHFVDQAHIGYTSWNDPPNNLNIMPNVTYISSSNTSAGLMGVGIQGTTAAYPQTKVLTTLSVDPYMPPSESRYIDIFARDNGTFAYTIFTNVSYVSVAEKSGIIEAPGINSDSRNVITVDWDTAPAGLSLVSLNIINSIDNSSATVIVPVNKTTIAQDFKGFAESNGVIAIEASHYSSIANSGEVSYIEVPDYGRTLSGMKLWPVLVNSQSTDTGPALKYSLYTTTSTTKARLVVMFGPSLNHDPSRPLRFAYSIDGSAPVTAQPVTNIPIYTEPTVWRNAIVSGGWTSLVTLPAAVTVGAHELTLWLLEPGLVLQKVVLDMGGLKDSAMGPLESKPI